MPSVSASDINVPVRLTSKLISADEYDALAYCRAEMESIDHWLIRYTAGAAYLPADELAGYPFADLLQRWPLISFHPSRLCDGHLQSVGLSEVWS